MKESSWCQLLIVSLPCKPLSDSCLTWILSHH